MKILLVRILFIIIGIMSALAISVVLDRVAGRYMEKRGYVVGMTPNVTEVLDTNEYSITVHISSQGLRNREVGEKGDGVYRILALGDSFTFGWGVGDEEMWVRRTEALLRDSGKKVEFINAGVPGVGLATQIEFCRAYANRFDVDAVIVGMYGTDDLYQNSVEAYDVPGEPLWLFRLWPTLARIKKTVIMDGWHPGTMSGTRVNMQKMWKTYARKLLWENPGLIDDIDPDIREDLVAGRVNPDLFLYALEEPQFLTKMLDSDNLNRALKATGHLFDRLKECTGKRPVVVVLLPPSEMVHSTYQSYRQATGYDVDERLLTFDLNTPISAVIDSRGLHMVSLFDEFRKDGCPDCYYPWDIHLTKTGNDRVARFLAPKLLEKIPGILSGSSP